MKYQIISLLHVGKMEAEVNDQRGEKEIKVYNRSPPDKSALREDGRIC